jgi:hypothetical protein
MACNRRFKMGLTLAVATSVIGQATLAQAEA